MRSKQYLPVYVPHRSVYHYSRLPIVQRHSLQSTMNPTGAQIHSCSTAQQHLQSPASQLRKTAAHNATQLHLDSTVSAVTNFMLHDAAAAGTPLTLHITARHPSLPPMSRPAVARPV